MKLEAKFLEPYQSWKKEPTPTNMGALLRAVNPILETGLRTYAGAGASPLLRSRARRIAMEAMGRYDPSRVQLSTYLMQQLQGLRRIKAQEQEPIKVPEQVRLERIQLDGAEKELRDRLGREPSTVELSDHLHLAPERIAKIRKVHSGLTEGSMTRYSDDEAVYSPAVAQQSDEPWLRFVHASLHPTDQVILEHSTGLFGRPQLSNNDIAKRLKISPSAISQRRTRIQSKLDQRDDLGIF
jgi:DNA-directed RNA polymerase specialized sigma subunit